MLGSVARTLTRAGLVLALAVLTASCGVGQGSQALGRYETSPSITLVAHLEESTVGVSMAATGETYLAQQGCLEFTDNSVSRYIPSAVMRLNPNGTTARVAGGFPACGFSGDGGPALRANLDHPSSILVDSAGNVYVADEYNHRVRRITPQGIITTIAGAGPAGYGRAAYAGDGGPATRARLNRPHGLALDSAGNLYITELENNVVRKVTSSGIISTIAGTGRRGLSGDGGPATAADLSFPTAVAVDNAGNIYIADEDNGRVRKVTPGGTITTIVGSGVRADPTDGTAATATPLDYPKALAVASDGTLFISDSEGHALLRLGKDGAVHVVAGPGQYWNPGALAFDADGNLLVIDTSDQSLYKLTWSH